MADHTYYSIIAHKAGKRLKMKSVKTFLKENEMAYSSFPEAIVVEATEGIIILFSFGVIIAWLDTHASHDILDTYNQFFIDGVHHSDHTFSAQIQEGSGEMSITNDRITLYSTDLSIMMSISYAIARSVQLETNETAIEALFEQIKDIPSRLRHHGKLNYSKKRVRQLIGGVIEAKYHLHSFGLVQDRPEILWSDDRLGKYYDHMAEYLELSDRWYVLQEKTTFLESTLDIMRDEINTRQGHLMEWAIIILFIIDIIAIIIEWTIL